MKKQWLMGLFFIPLLSYGQGEFLSVCDRTPQVRDVIMEKIAAIDPSIECSDDDLLRPLLSEIKELPLYSGVVNSDGVRFPDITSFKVGDFSGIISVEYLNLSAHRITAIPEGIFSDLVSLKRLDLSFNKIADVHPNAFSGLVFLEKLDLDGNKIASLSENTFFNLPALKFVNLHRNFLEEQTISRLRLYFENQKRGTKLIITEQEWYQ